VCCAAEGGAVGDPMDRRDGAHGGAKRATRWK
jgi:hypothetical protein